MIRRVELQEHANRLRLAERVVEKDYVIGWLLSGIAEDADLADTWVFKGGTCLKKCYIETYRFSEDLDFTVIPSKALKEEEIASALRRIIEVVGRESGIDFSARPPYVKVQESGFFAEGRVYYAGPRGGPVERIKLDLTSDEKLVQPAVLRPIAHPYGDTLNLSAEARCYGFEELFAEKIRAMGERSRPRDLYDIINLFWRQEFREHGALIKDLLVAKCANKGIDPVSFNTVNNSPHRGELEREWANMLGHQLPEPLPDFEQYWLELPNLFAWLDGEVLETLPSLGVDEDTDPGWSPPLTFWTKGDGLGLEPVRFAAANRLCVDLAYQGRTRVIEPYSLRRVTSGAVLLHAIKADTREHRSYRIDRIQSVKVLNRPFKPVWAIEFTSTGPLPIQAAASTRSSRPSARRLRRPRLINYTIECVVCGKRFYRERPSTRIGKHKAKDSDWICAGRTGYYV